MKWASHLGICGTHNSGNGYTWSCVLREKFNLRMTVEKYTLPRKVARATPEFANWRVLSKTRTSTVIQINIIMFLQLLDRSALNEFGTRHVSCDYKSIPIFFKSWTKEDPVSLAWGKTPSPLQKEPYMVQTEHDATNRLKSSWLTSELKVLSLEVSVLPAEEKTCSILSTSTFFVNSHFGLDFVHWTWNLPWPIKPVGNVNSRWSVLLPPRQKMMSNKQPYMFYYTTY